jgi:cytochrome bd-type quinol oxidase subunit 2
MKQQTRDNLIYLAVGLGLAALLAFDAFYSDSHNRKMWMPSRFAFNVVAFMGVLVFMVVRETRKVRATVGQTVVSALAACSLHSGFASVFPRIFSERFGSGLWVFIVLELFLIVCLMVGVIRYIHRVHRPA